MTRLALVCLAAGCLCACTAEAPDTRSQPASSASHAPAGYLDYTGRQDLLAGGVRMSPVNTPEGPFRVWT